MTRLLPGWVYFKAPKGLPRPAGGGVERLDAAAGAVNDARPDRWGERVIRHIFKPVRLSLLEYLYFAGHDRFGALGVSLHESHYNALPANAIATFENLPQMQSIF